MLGAIAHLGLRYPLWNAFVRQGTYLWSGGCGVVTDPMDSTTQDSGIQGPIFHVACSVSPTA
jgi:hypothetical protein